MEEEEKIEEGTPPKEEKKEEESPVKKAEEILKGLREENERMERNLREAREVTAEAMLSGKGEASVKKSKEDREKEEAMKLVEGTGLNPFE